MARYVTRPATEADVGVLRDLYRRSVLTNENDSADLLAHPEALRWDGDGIAERRTRVAVDDDGRVVGFATAVEIDGGHELTDLFVDPDAMRQGVATQLVQEAVAEATRSGAPRIDVTGNQHAAEFYASAGFVRIGDEQTLFGSAPRLRLVLSGSGRRRSTYETVTKPGRPT
jgi:GNAT superfamily N-acetyltransferase